MDARLRPNAAKVQGQGRGHGSRPRPRPTFWPRDHFGLEDSTSLAKMWNRLWCEICCSTRTTAVRSIAWACARGWTRSATRCPARSGAAGDSSCTSWSSTSTSRRSSLWWSSPAAWLSYVVHSRTRQPMTNRPALLAHWSVRQKLNRVSSVEFSYVLDVACRAYLYAPN